MITKQTKLFYFVGTTPYASLEEAQKADLLRLMPDDWAANRTVTCDWLMDNAQAIAEILTTTPRSRNRKPRKDKGVPRKVKAPEVTP